MSQTKHMIDAAAEALDVPVDELTAYLTGDNPPRRMPPHGAVAAPVTATVYRAADDLDVHPVDLDRWLKRRDGLDARVAAQVAADGRPREVIRDESGDALAILVHRPEDDTAPPSAIRAELVSEDDYRGLAADLVARWADGHMAPHDALAALNLAAHGMPVTTPSRRALAKIRDVVERTGGMDDARDVARELTAILDEVGA